MIQDTTIDASAVADIGAFTEATKAKASGVVSEAGSCDTTALLFVLPEVPHQAASCAATNKVVHAESIFTFRMILSALDKSFTNC